MTESRSTAGRVVPGLTIDDDGRARSWWWPLPAADDRATLRGLLTDTTEAAHRAAADALADHVDAVVRHRLAGKDLLPRRPGRRTLPEMWLQSLVSPDPWLPSSIDATRARALADAAATWVESGRAASGRLGVCLRIHEPEQGQTPAPWTVEVLVADEEDVGMRTPMASWWPDAARYGAEAGNCCSPTWPGPSGSPPSCPGCSTPRFRRPSRWTITPSHPC